MNLEYISNTYLDVERFFYQISQKQCTFQKWFFNWFWTLGWSCGVIFLQIGFIVVFFWQPCQGMANTLRFIFKT